MEKITRIEIATRLMAAYIANGKITKMRAYKTNKEWTKYCMFISDRFIALATCLKLRDGTGSF